MSGETKLIILELNSCIIFSLGDSRIFLNTLNDYFHDFVLHA